MTGLAFRPERARLLRFIELRDIRPAPTMNFKYLATELIGSIATTVPRKRALSKVIFKDAHKMTANICGAWTLKPNNGKVMQRLVTELVV